ncbi:dehydrogenase reductase [Colletotrichum plurivorum]|uniref:Dehydrogenase reductase n=1 Tax=Colletotrichum plurivorum TaxID=2175906 RepID=A0A8H6JH16_9PEZI|nr:dehydrogenase reductase [Colletotrichum plurivorum]
MTGHNSSYEATILITGGTRGLGLEAAKTLSRHNPQYQIIVASSTLNDAAQRTIRASSGNMTFMPLDLSSPNAVRQFVDRFSSGGYPPIKALLLNAGVQFREHEAFTDDGVEKTFAVNHIGHMHLFLLLRPHLSKDARIVITSSGTHDPRHISDKLMPHPCDTSAEDLAHPRKPQSPDSSNPTRENGRRYSTSKLCNLLFMHALDRRLKRDGKEWTVLALDPGFMPRTGLARQSVWSRMLLHYFLLILRPFLYYLFSYDNIRTPAESGEALAFLASANELQGKSARYFVGKREVESSADSYSLEKQEDLWNWTIRYLARDEVELTNFEDNTRVC